MQAAEAPVAVMGDQKRVGSNVSVEARRWEGDLAAADRAVKAGGGGGRGAAPWVRIVEEDGVRSRFIVGGVDFGVANALRRALMSEVDIMAIDRMDVHASTSMMNDELLFNRLGLIPLCCSSQTVLDSYRLPAECDCEERQCPRCAAGFRLKACNQTDETIEVTSHDLVPLQPHVRPIGTRILIANLGKGQEVDLTLYAYKSNVRRENNAKWNPTTVASYRPVADIHVNAALINAHLAPDEQRRLCASEPAQVLLYDESARRIVPHPDAALRCTYGGEFLETLARTLHPTLSKAKPKAAHDPNQTAGSVGIRPDGNPMSLAGQPAPGADAKADTSVLAGVWRMEEELGKRFRRPEELLHPFVSMVPREDAFLFALRSTGCMPPRAIVSRAISALRARLAALRALNRRPDILALAAAPIRTAEN
jgi:hypothetical protein